MTTIVKAKDLREGDKVVTPDGTYTVVRNRQVKVKIPSRLVKQQRLLLEYSSRKGGVTKKRTDVDTVWDTTEFEIADRKDFKSKMSRFTNKHAGYLNALAIAMTGAILPVILNVALIIPFELAVAMQIGAGVVASALAIDTYRKAR